MFKRSLSVILAVILAFGVMSAAAVSVGAAETELADTGLTFQEGDFFYRVLEDGSGVQVEAYLSDAADVTIPATAGPYTVVGIEEMTFFSNTNIKTVKLPNKLQFIGEGAFAQCSALESVAIPKSVTQIGARAFYHCPALKNVDFRAKAATIPEGCFDGDTSLSSFDFPFTVTSIGERAFYGCPLSWLMLPIKLVSVGAYAFADNREMYGLTIPNTVTSIGSYAFGYDYDDESGLYDAKLDFYIYGRKGTAAEQYAKDNNFLFVALLDTPQLNKVENTTDGVKFSYKKVDGAQKYRVLRRSGNNPWQKLADTAALSYTDKTAKLTYTDKNVKKGTKYTYTARCISGDAKSYTSAYNTAGKAITYK